MTPRKNWKRAYRMARMVRNHDFAAKRTFRSDELVNGVQVTFRDYGIGMKVFISFHGSARYYRGLFFEQMTIMEKQLNVEKTDIFWVQNARQLMHKYGFKLP